MIRRWISPILALALTAPAAWANSVVTVQSTVDSQNSYEIVFQSDKADTQQEPGIYSFVRGKDEAQLVVKGKVLDVSRAFNGVLAQFDIARTTHGYESVAVVNGRLTIFNKHSVPNSSKSIISFGENTPLIDAITGARVPIELITSTKPENINVQIVDSDKDGEVILVSVRQPNILGSGITFAAVLKNKSGPLELLGDPVIVDYSFLTGRELSKLYVEDFKILSRNHLLNLAQGNDGDDRIMRRYRESVAKLAGEIRGRGDGARQGGTSITERTDPKTGRAFSPPLLNLKTRQVLATELPVESLIEVPFRITQRIDPFRGRSGLFLGDDQLDEAFAGETHPQIPGRADYDIKSSRYKIADVAKPPKAEEGNRNLDQAAVLVSVDNQVYAAFRDAKQEKIHGVNLTQFLKPEFLAAKRISGMKLTWRDPANTGGSVHYLFLSAELPGSQEVTLVVKILETADYLKPIEVINLQKKFFTLTDLRRRIVQAPDPNAPNQLDLLFDNINAKLPADEEAVKEKQKTIPMVDLMRSMSGRISQRYIEPLRESQLWGRYLVWRYFDQEGAVENKSGIYHEGLSDPSTTGVSSKHLGFLQGMLLTDADKHEPGEEPAARDRRRLSPERIEPIKIEANLELDRKDAGKIRMLAVPYAADEDVKADKVGFRLAIYLVEESTGGPERVKPMLTHLYLPIDFNRFQGLRVVQGRRKATEDLTLLVFAGDKDASTVGAGPTRGGAGVLAIPLKLQVKPDYPLDTLVLQDRGAESTWLHSGQLSPVAVKDRVHFDAEGNALWVKNAELEKSDRNYGLMYLAQPQAKVIYPNQGLNRVTVRYDEHLDDDWSLLFGNKSRWLIDYLADLESRFPVVAQYLNAQRKKTEELSGKKKRRRESLFPELNDYLNQLAGTQSPNAHNVLLVDPKLYDTVRNLILGRFVERADENKWHIGNDDLHLHAYDPTFTPEETLQTLQRIGKVPGKREVLFVDMNMVLDTEFANRPLSFNPAAVRTVPVVAATPVAKPKEEKKKDEAAAPAGEEEEEDEGEETETASAEGSTPAPTTQLTEREAGDNFTFPYARLAFVALEGDTVKLQKFGDQLPAHKFSTLILATPAQWRDLHEAFPDEAKAGAFKRYKIDARFLTGAWTVWSPKSNQASKEVIEAYRNPISRDEYQVFQNLERLLMQIADPKTQAEHQMLVVPEEIKPLIMRLINGRWATDNRELEGLWNYKNRNLALFQVKAGDATQQTISDNFESMRGNLSSRRPVLMADMADLLRIGRPGDSNTDRVFRLKDPVTADKNQSILSGNEPVDDIDRSQLPHMLWWMATEGRKIQPKKTQGWTVEQDAPVQIPTLIITTQKELETIEQDAGFESRFVDFRKSFRITNLDKPAEDEKRRLLEDLFKRPEIAALHYQFTHEQLGSEEARRQLVGLTIGKVEQIARQLKIESTYAFLKIYSALKRALTDDVELRRNRQIDSSYLFRLFARVFPLPLSYEIMRADDPLQRARDPERAARGLTEAGYEGAMELKTRGMRGFTAHTRGGTEAGRNIPSSVVLIGDKGSGKTFLVKTVIKYLGLKEYDYNKPYDEEVGAMTIRVMDIVDEDDPAHPEKLSISKVKKHIDNFLAMPNGWRGLILFDDLHKAGSTKILKELMTYIQTLFEAPNGMIKVRRMSNENNGEVKEIPVRNLMMAITLNPTKDKTKRERFIERYGKKDPVLEAIAALHRDDYQIEDSVFSRVGDVIDLSEFPRDAKVPSLLGKLREANLQEFSAHPRVVAVTSGALNSLVNTFPHSNARDFLTPATYSLLSLPNETSKAPFYIVDHLKTDTPVAGGEDRWGAEGSKVEPGKIEEALRSTTVVHAIRVSDPRSKLHFLGFLLDNFRGLVYNSVVLGTQASPEISGNHERRVTLMASFLTAVVGNLTEFPRLPISSVAVKPGDLGVREFDAIRDLQTAVEQHSSNINKPKIHIPTAHNSEEHVDLSTFLGVEAPNLPERRRQDVLIATSRRLKGILEPLLAQSLQVETIAQLTSPAAWVGKLSETDPKDAFKKASDEILKEFTRFSRELYDVGLVEMRERGGIAQMQIYDEVRLFLLCMDSAVTQLPWSFVTEFVLQSLDLATRDLAMGQKIGLQHFLFKSMLSPMATMTPEAIVANAQSISVMKDVTPERAVRWQQYFSDNCERFLIPEKAQ